MTYACSPWEFAADSCLIKLQRLENKVIRTTADIPRCTSVHSLHKAFKLSYVVYDDIAILPVCRRQAGAIRNHVNADVHNTVKHTSPIQEIQYT
jgi:aminoglycoside N3'-acetyltransferase